MRIEFELLDTGAAVRAPVETLVTPARAAPVLEFDLPQSLLLQLVATAAGFLLVMGLAFRGGTGIGLVLAVSAMVFAGYYGLPVVMARASRMGRPAQRAVKAKDWGIETASGYLPGGAASAQVMTVPLLILAWAIFIAFLH